MSAPSIEVRHLACLARRRDYVGQLALEHGKPYHRCERDALSWVLDLVRESDPDLVDEAEALAVELDARGNQR